MDVDSFMDFFAAKQRENETRMANMESSISDLRGQITANTLMTAESKGELREVLDILHAVKGGLKVLGAIGNGIKWVAAVAGAWVVLSSFWRGVFPWGK